MARPNVWRKLCVLARDDSVTVNLIGSLESTLMEMMNNVLV